MGSSDDSGSDGGLFDGVESFDYGGGRVGGAVGGSSGGGSSGGRVGLEGLADLDLDGGLDNLDDLDELNDDINGFGSGLNGLGGLRRGLGRGGLFGGIDTDHLGG
jgi:hypothetical protein